VLSFVGMMMSFAVYFMLLLPDFESAGNGLKYFLQFVPHFSITFGFMRFSVQVVRNNRCKIQTVACPGNDVCCRKFVNYLIRLLMSIEMLIVSHISFIINCNFN
jgi:hypothetical protein